MNSTFNSRPNMSEQEILSYLLSSEKQLVKEYASDISESSCANLRGLLANNLVECSADQLAIFEQMNQRGFYKTKQAPPSALRSAFSFIISRALMSFFTSSIIAIPACFASWVRPA